MKHIGLLIVFAFAGCNASQPDSSDMAAAEMMAPVDHDMRGGDMVDACLGLPPAIRTVAWSGADAGYADCVAHCETVRPALYEGSVNCRAIPADGGGGAVLECTFYPCGL